MKKIDPKVIIAGISCITLIELFALSKGIDGSLLAFVIGIISVAIGIHVPQENFYKKANKALYGIFSKELK